VAGYGSRVTRWGEFWPKWEIIFSCQCFLKKEGAHVLGYFLHGKIDALTWKKRVGLHFVPIFHKLL
jgi:hypothetical protein